MKTTDLRIGEHPILEFERGAPVKLTFDGVQILAYDNETIVTALHAAGFRVLGHSEKKHRPRGLYCAIGNCSSCMMIVNGEPNVKICIELAQDGMVVETQKDKGALL